MKVEFKKDKVIVYLYNKLLNINNNEELKHQVKDIFIQIMKRYNLNFFGYNKVNVYHNVYYGIILEIEKLYDNDIRYNIIDLKIIVYKNIPLYLEFDDICFDISLSRIKKYNNKYYLEINNSKDIIRYIEYGKVQYLPIIKKLLNEID